MKTTTTTTTVRKQDPRMTENLSTASSNLFVFFNNQLLADTVDKLTNLPLKEVFTYFFIDSILT